MPKDYQEKRPIEGTKLWLVGRDVPVVDMEKDSLFSSNVSWLIQEALGCSGRAEGQFEYCDDRNIVQDCVGLGFHRDDVSVARLNRDDLKHLKAAGVAGKRSVMMACLVALYRDQGRHTMNHKAFWKALQDYELEKAWERLMDTIEEEADAWNSYNSRYSGGRSGSGGGYSDYYSGNGYGNGSSRQDVLNTPWEGHGVTVNVVCNCVPVIDLAPHSIFHGNASWLLQAASGSCGKADGLFEYFQDRDVMAACHQKLKLTKDELSIARLKSRPDLIAVGTTGKRSVMLALCLVLAWDDQTASNMLESDIQESDKSLKDPLSDVLVAMHQRIKVSKDRSWMGSRGGNSHGSDYYSGGGGGGGGGYDFPRGRAASSRRSSYRQASISRSPKRKSRREKKPRAAAPNAADLDEQLKEYMTHNSNRTRD